MNTFSLQIEIWIRKAVSYAELLIGTDAVLIMARSFCPKTFTGDNPVCIAGPEEEENFFPPSHSCFPKRTTKDNLETGWKNELGIRYTQSNLISYDLRPNDAFFSLKLCC